MNKQAKTALVTTMVVVALLAIGIVVAPGGPQCNDSNDNDGDGHIDLTDSKCISRHDKDESPRDFCNDSDGGIVSGTQGTVSGEDNSVTFSNTDSCLVSGALREYYCGGQLSDYDPLFTDITCGNQTTCSNGACV